MTGKRAEGQAEELSRAEPAPGAEPAAKPAAKHGYDGNPPRFMPVRDLAGLGKRASLGVQNINVDRLEWLLARGRISPHQHQAGRRLQRERELAQIGGYATLDSGTVESGRSGGVNRLSDVKCDAIAAVNAARAYVGNAGWRILELVVLEGLALSKAELRSGLAAGSGMGALTVALDALARHFRMA